MADMVEMPSNLMIATGKWLSTNEAVARCRKSRHRNGQFTSAEAGKFAESFSGSGDFMHFPAWITGIA